MKQALVKISVGLTTVALVSAMFSQQSVINLFLGFETHLHSALQMNSAAAITVFT